MVKPFENFISANRILILPSASIQLTLYFLDWVSGRWSWMAATMESTRGGTKVIKVISCQRLRHSVENKKKSMA